MRILRKIKLLNNLYKGAFEYTAPINLNNFWNFGSLAFILLIMQIISGIFLAMHYVPEISLAFLSVEKIMRDLDNGWLLRYWHANGASFFFFYYISTYCKSFIL